MRTGRPAYHEVFGRPFWDDLAAHSDVAASFDALMAGVPRAHPSVRGILVDLPTTVARAAEILEPAGVADRVTLAGQSFFDPLPAGADLYLLKSVLFDWPDAEATRILRRLAEAARPAGRIVIIGGVSPDESGEPAPELLMLVLVGGKGRTLSAFEAMAQEAGLRVSAAGRQSSGRFLVECAPA